MLIKVLNYFQKKKFLEKYKKSAKKILGNTEYIRSNSILLNVFFKKYDAAVINSNEYDTMMELNPSISKKIKILEESPRIFNFMFIAFSKNLNNDDMKNYHKILYDFLSDKNKNELFNLLKIKSIETEADNIKDLAKYYKEYLKLKKRYDK